MKIDLIEASHWHAPLYINALASTGARVVAVTDQNSEVVARVAARLGRQGTVDYKSMLAEHRPDFIFAFGRHREMPAICLDKSIGTRPDSRLGNTTNPA